MDRYQSHQDGVQPNTRRSWISSSSNEGVGAHADAQSRDGSRHRHRYQSQPQQQFHPDSHPDSHLHLTHQATNNIPTQLADESDDPPAYTPRIPARTSSLNHSTNGVSGTSSNITPLSRLIKQRRRRCGGIFRPIEPSSGSGSGSAADRVEGGGGHGGLGFEYEYEWPYSQNINGTNKTDGRSRRERRDGTADADDRTDSNASTENPNGIKDTNDPSVSALSPNSNRLAGNPNTSEDAAGDMSGEGGRDRNANANTTGRGTGRGRAWHTPNLPIDTAAVNEMYFRRFLDGEDQNPEPPAPIRDSHVEERGKDSFDDRRRRVGRHDFERDVEGLGIDVAVTASARDAKELAETSEARNGIQGSANADADADADRKSIRSPSIYSQWSLESDQSGYNVIRKTHTEWYMQNRRAIDAPTTSPQSLVPDENSIKRRIRDANESWNRLKQKREAGKNDDKSIRSVSSQFSGIKRVASGLGERANLMAGRARELFRSLRIPRRRSERVVEGGRGREVGAREDDDARTLLSSEQGRLSEADGVTDQMANIGLDGGRQGRPKVVKQY